MVVHASGLIRVNALQMYGQDHIAKLVSVQGIESHLILISLTKPFASCGHSTITFEIFTTTIQVWVPTDLPSVRQASLVMGSVSI